jgi:uncharacterized membrane protein
MRMGRWIVVALAIGAFCSADVPAKKPPQPPADDGVGYNLLVLAPPGIAISGSLARDLDEFGNVVGYYSNSVDDRNGFYYDRSDNSYILYDPGVEVSGLNNLGEMVGTDWCTGEGLYWSTPDANPVPLSPLTGHETSAGFKVNDAGIIVGRSQGDGFPVAVVWKVNQAGEISAPIELPYPLGDIRGAAIRLNEEDNSGVTHVVGYSGLETVYETALRWTVAVDADGALFLLSGPTDLGSLDGGTGSAHGINYAGDIVGESDNWPFVKPAGQAMQPLAGLRKATNGYALGINDSGSIVGSQGYLFKGKPVSKAVFWHADGAAVDLNGNVELGRSDMLESAAWINNAGDIIGSGVFPDRYPQARDVGFLLISTE